MHNIAVVGLQWGDEGKGKIVDWLSEKFDVVVRFQGGNNAGHTVVFSNNTYKLNLLPSSVLREDKISVIGNGVAIDPHSLISEIENIQKRGIDVGPHNLILSENCCLVLNIHKELDVLLEKLRNMDSIGTTHKGIGPCYEDKVARRAIRLSDLLYERDLTMKLDHLVSYHNLLRKSFGLQNIDKQKILEELSQITSRISIYIKPAWRILNEFIKENKKIIFEGAQGISLDLDYGTYPYTTSSNTLPSQINAGCGVNLFTNKIIVLGLIKAYTTRVGNGPFITEQNNELGNILFEKGKELGTVSNRKRRCGWFDAVLVRQNIILSGATYLILTKLDVLDFIDNINICVGYRYNNIEYDYLPSSLFIQEKLEPIYESLPGWNKSTFAKDSLDEIPENAVNYIKRLEELLGVPIQLISTGPDRKHIINKQFKIL